jgi:hypothetical protein
MWARRQSRLLLAVSKAVCYAVGTSFLCEICADLDPESFFNNGVSIVRSCSTAVFHVATSRCFISADVGFRDFGGVLRFCQRVWPSC